MSSSPRPRSALKQSEGPNPGEMTEAFWRRRPQTAGVKVTDKLKKITLVILGDKLPSGRSRVTLFPNRFRTLGELFELLDFELKSAEGEPLRLDPSTHNLELLNPQTNNYDLLTDTTMVKDLGRLRIVKKGQVIHSTSGMKPPSPDSRAKPLGIRPATAGATPSSPLTKSWGQPAAISPKTSPHHQQRRKQSLPPTEAVGAGAGAAASGDLTSLPPPIIIQGANPSLTTTPWDDALTSVASSGNFPVVAAGASSHHHQQHHHQYQQQKQQQPEQQQQQGVPQSFSLNSPSGLLLLYHAKLVTFMSTKVSVDCDVNTKDLTEMEVRYEEAATKLVSQLQHMEPPRAMKVLTQLALQQGKCERGFLDSEEVVRLRSDLAQEKARSARLEIDLDACHHDIAVLKGKLDEFSQHSEKRRVQSDVELVTHRDNERRLKVEVAGLQRMYDALTQNIENENQEAQRPDPNEEREQRTFKAGSLRPATAPTVCGHRLPAKRGHGGKGSLATEDAPSRTPSAASGATAKVQFPFPSPSQNLGSVVEAAMPQPGEGDSFHAPVQFVRLDGKTYCRRVLFATSNLALSTLAGLENFLIKQMEACALEEANEKRLVEERKGGRRVSAASVNVSNRVRIRTVKNNKLTDVASSAEAQDVFERLRSAILANVAAATEGAAALAPGHRGAAIPPLLCLEQPPSNNRMSFDSVSSSNTAAFCHSPFGQTSSMTPGGHGGGPSMSLKQRQDALLNAASMQNQAIPAPALKVQPTQIMRDNINAEPGPGPRVRSGSVTSIKAMREKRRAPTLFKADSMHATAHEDEDVMKATWAKLGGTDEGAKGITVGSLLKYLKSEFDEMGIQDRFEKVIGKAMKQSDKRSVMTTSGAAGALRANDIQINPKFIVKWEPFCMILLQVVRE